MNTEVFLHVDDSQASVKINGKITAGAVGIPVHVTIEGSRWSGLSAELVASCNGVDKCSPILDGECELPWECLISKKKLFIGVDGASEDGTLRIPTIFAYCGEVFPSVDDAHPTNQSEPTPDIVDRILAAADRAVTDANSVVQKADNGDFNGVSPTFVIEDVEGGHNVIITDANGVHTFNVPDGKTPEVVVTKVNGKSGEVSITADDVEAMKYITFRTRADAVSWMSDEENIGLLKAGDMVFIDDVSVSDMRVIAGRTVANLSTGMYYDVYDIKARPQDLTAYAKKSELNTVATSGSYNDLSNKPSIPSKTSELRNDSGYLKQDALQEYAKTNDIPNVPQWAMQETKPTYTASEVGTYRIVKLTREQYDALNVKSDSVMYAIVGE